MPRIALLRMQLHLSEGQEAEEKLVGYKRALARAYVHYGQPQKAVPYLEELLAQSAAPRERLELLCSLADAQASPLQQRADTDACKQQSVKTNLSVAGGWWRAA